MKKLFFTYILLSIYWMSSSQNNLVPNPGFENGVDPECSINCVGKFNGNIDYWNNAIKHPAGCQCLTSCGFCLIGWGCSTSDWYDINDCGVNIAGTTSDRFVGSNGHSFDPEGVMTSLLQNLTAGQSYTLRFRYASSQSNARELIYVTRYSTHWSKKTTTNGNKKFFIGEFGGPGIFVNNDYSDNTWTSFQTSFTLPSNFTQISNIIFSRNANGMTFLDDVELFEGNCNTGDLYISNKTYVHYEYPYEFQHIVSGSNAYPNNPGNVYVQANANVTYKAAQEVTLTDGFEASNGTEFHAYIAPCGSACPYPTMPTSDTEICDGLPITIGTQPIQGLSYSWQGLFPSDNYLSSTSVANPTFTPPSGAGSVTYTVQVINGCFETSTNFVTVTYDDSPNSNPYVNYSSVAPGNYIPGPGWIQFNINNYSPHTDVFHVEIYEAVSGNLVYDEDDIKPQGASFNYSTFPKGFDQCKTYLVKLSSKNICFENYSTPITFTVTPPATQTVIVPQPYPNIFTPNGDEINDQFCFNNITGATSFTVTIYDAGGVPIYSNSSNIVGTTACVWDGTCNQNCGVNTCNGCLVCNGTYFYVLEFSNCNTGLPSIGISDWVQLQSGLPDGCSRYANPDLLTSGAFSDSIYGTSKVYPNPSKDEFSFISQNLSGGGELLVKDVYGNILFTKNISPNSSNSFNFSLMQYANGIYLLEFNSVKQKERHVLLKSN